MGLDNPSLVALDGLHPSELAYSKFVERLLPIALEKIEWVIFLWLISAYFLLQDYSCLQNQD